MQLNRNKVQLKLRWVISEGNKPPAASFENYFQPLSKWIEMVLLHRACKLLKLKMLTSASRYRHVF